MVRALVINPGSTSTKVAVFDDEKQIAQENITHENEVLCTFKKTSDQAPYRLEAIRGFLKKYNIAESSLNCVVGRGGPLKPIPSGTYTINDIMLQDLIEAKRADHPSNLGGIIANIISKGNNIPAFIIDPVSVDEFPEIVRVAGFPECERASLGHALNIRAVSRVASQKIGKNFDEANFVVAHMGGGISIAPVKGGHIIDYNNANEGGPFSPERSGGLPLSSLVELCATGKYTESDIKILTTKKGGMLAYLGTNDVPDMIKKAQSGDKQNSLIFEGMIQQIAQEIGEMATVLHGEIDGIILTGSIAYSDVVDSKIKELVSHIAPVINMAGQMEMEALAQGGLRVLRGVEKAREY